MQKSRRWRGLELLLLSLVPAACSPAAAPAPAPKTSAAESADRDTESETASTGKTAASPNAKPTTEDEPAPSASLPKGTRVLQIGDSFADALGGRLAKLLREAEVRSNLEFETPSYIPNWSY